MKKSVGNFSGQDLLLKKISPLGFHVYHLVNPYLPQLMQFHSHYQTHVSCCLKLLASCHTGHPTCKNLHLLIFWLEDRLHFTACFGDVHTFGYNSAKSEPIWMKSGALGVYCRRLASGPGIIRTVATAGESGEVLSCHITNALFPVGQISQNLNTTCWSVLRWKLPEQNFEDFYHKGLFFQKMQKFLNNF